MLLCILCTMLVGLLPWWIAVVSVPEAGRVSAVVVNTVILVLGLGSDGEGRWGAIGGWRGSNIDFCQYIGFYWVKYRIGLCNCRSFANYLCLACICEIVHMCSLTYLSFIYVERSLCLICGLMHVVYQRCVVPILSLICLLVLIVYILYIWFKSFYLFVLCNLVGSYYISFDIYHFFVFVVVGVFRLQVVLYSIFLFCKLF
jgi:hypothetical protein